MKERRHRGPKRAIESTPYTSRVAENQIQSLHLFPYTSPTVRSRREGEGERAIPNMDNGLLSFGFPPPPPPPPSFKSSSARAAPNRRCAVGGQHRGGRGPSTCNVWTSKPAAGGLRWPRGPRRGHPYPKRRPLVEDAASNLPWFVRNGLLIAPSAAAG